MSVLKYIRKPCIKGTFSSVTQLHPTLCDPMCVNMIKLIAKSAVRNQTDILLGRV